MSGQQKAIEVAIADWMAARDKVASLQRDLRDADEQKNKATEYLGQLVMPPDANNNEVYCVPHLGRILEVRVAPRRLGTHGMDKRYEIHWRQNMEKAEAEG